MLLLVKCKEPTCKSPYFYIPSLENYTVIGVNTDAGEFAVKSESASETQDGEDDKTVNLIDGTTVIYDQKYDDYLVVYCDEGHKNYIPIKKTN